MLRFLAKQTNNGWYNLVYSISSLLFLKMEGRSKRDETNQTQSMLQKIKVLGQKWKRWSETDTGKTIFVWLRRLLVVLIVSYLFYQIYEIGFAEIIAALPRIPAFYLLFLLIYMLLPLSELLIYRTVLPVPSKEGFLAFLRKKILNTDVIGYSGEAYLFVWMRDHLPVETKRVFQVIKDNTILSSMASTFTAIILIIVFAMTGTVDFLSFIPPRIAALLLGLLITILLGLFFFGNRLISMGKTTALKIYSIHQIRLFVVYGLEIFNWSLVVPEVPWNIWFTFLAMKIIASRIPFLPSQDVLFVAVGIEFSKYLSVSSAAIGGVFLAGNILSKIISLVFFSAMGLSKLKTKENVEI